MASGGARARSGPPPDPNALRRDRDGADWLTLPADGRAGDPPEWPLTRPSKRELALWEREWRRPQAILWEENGLELEVALYVRSVAKAEKSDAPVNLRTLVKQQQEALGISLPGMQRNRWKIGVVKPAAESTSRVPGRSARSRFEVVTGGAA
jgi:hypothetical protein